MSMTSPPHRLDVKALRRGVRFLSDRDPELAAVVAEHGEPPLWNRRPGFSSLVRIILEQQVSLASGRATYQRLSSQLGSVSPAVVQRAGIDELRRIGITRQKASYMLDAAEQILAGKLSLSVVARTSDAEARVQLQQVKGVGPWTADIYLLMALGRPDVWPHGDLALDTALQCLRGLPGRPSTRESHELSASWSPWRSVAARILWHGYLQGSLRVVRDR